MSREELEMKLLILRELKIRKARSSFWEFCKLLYPEFYKDNRTYLKELCDNMQNIYEGKILNDEGKPYKKIILSIPPRHGKTFTKDNFIKWVFGQNPSTTKVISASYSKDLSITSSRNIRNGIMDMKNEPQEIVYSDIFPDTIISSGNASVGQWSIEGAAFSYKAASLSSAVTGMGTNLSVIDDLVADSFVANNERELDKIYQWYTDTFLSREEKDSISIMIGTRWNSKDPIGRVLEGEDSKDWINIELKAYDEEKNEMLCEELLPREKYEQLSRNMSRHIFLANYQQTPVDQEGKLYKQLLSYDAEPLDYDRIIAYIDTADTGEDHLCMIVGLEKDKELFIKDVYFTKDSMEITEKEVAKRLNFIYEIYNVPFTCKIESNNGGRNFARTVERLLWDTYRNRKVKIDWFTQRENKHSRILSYSSYVMNHVFFPFNWNNKWKDFYNHISGYQSESKSNKHDDGADCLTGICQMVDEKKKAKAGLAIY